MSWALNSTIRTRLGTLEAFANFPAPIEVGSQTFFLVRADQGFRLLSSVCPHAGGEVYDEGSCFECPLHGSCFDVQTGSVRILPATKPARSYQVKVEGNSISVGPRK